MELNMVHADIEEVAIKDSLMKKYMEEKIKINVSLETYEITMMVMMKQMLIFGCI